MSEGKRPPGLIIIDDNDERALRLRTASAIARHRPLVVRWGPQVPPLVRLVDPRSVIAAYDGDGAKERELLKQIRIAGYTRAVLAIGKHTDRHTTHDDRDAGVTARVLEADIESALEMHAPPQVIEAEAEMVPVQLLKLGATTIDLDNGDVVRDGARTRLAPRELALLDSLARRAGKVVTRETLLAEVWNGEDKPTSRVVDRQVVLLRQRVEADPRNPQHVLTVFAEGYRLIATRAS